MIRCNASRRGKITADVNTIAADRDGVHAATHSRVEGHPLTAIPAGNSSNAATIADTAEITSSINVRAVHNDRLDRAGCSAAEGQPVVPIPLGQVIDARAPGPADIAAGVHFAAVA